MPLALSGEEGRGKLREAWGSGKHIMIPGLPNGVTQQVRIPATYK